MIDSRQAPSFKELSQCLRFLTVDAIEKAGSGHPGMPLGMADVATVLWMKHMRFSVEDPRWPGRDRFVLSAGHGSMLLYALLYLTGYSDITLDDIQNFRQEQSPCAGHPEYGLLSGVETTTGPLAQGLGNAVGMALSEAMTVRRYGPEYAHHVYTMCGDGCLMEGLSHEVASFAGHHGLRSLIVFFDDNGITIDGETSLTCSEDTIARFQDYGWHTQRTDGHDEDAIDQAIMAAKADHRPSLIACRTIIGRGSKNEGTARVHGAPLGADDIQAMRTSCGWPEAPFEIPARLLEIWRARGKEATKCAKKLEKPWVNHQPTPQKLTSVVQEQRKIFAQASKPMATRQASHKVLEGLLPHLPTWVGGSADLTPSNNTYVETWGRWDGAEHEGRYIHYGVREHGMAAMMNGLALQGVFRPFGGTFLVFSDYMRPSMRLSAMMNLPVVFVLTHDSIGLGEDGPTHQPVEHLASLRMIPGLKVYRPADAVEVAECWGVISQDDSPAVLALTRQAVPLLPRSTIQEDLPCAQGGYIVRDHPRACISLIATGSEVHVALQVQEHLEEDGVFIRIISMPCVERFEVLSESERERILPPSWPVWVIEAGHSAGWTTYTKDQRRVVSMDCFGHSAPASKLWKRFGFDPASIAKRIKASL